MDRDVLNNYFSTIDKDDPILQIKTLVDSVRDRLREIIDTPHYTTVLMNVLSDVKVCLQSQILEKRKLEEEFINQIEDMNLNTPTHVTLEITNKYYKNLEMINILDKQINYIDSIAGILSFNNTGINNNMILCNKMYEKYLMKMKQKEDDNLAMHEDLVKRYKLINKEILEV